LLQYSTLMPTAAIAAASRSYEYTFAVRTIPQTGQTSCYDAAGSSIACSGTGQDGDKKAGVAWPDPRFTDNWSNALAKGRFSGLKDGQDF
jgi:hypothetical protein